MGMGNLCLQQLCDVRDNSCVICASFIVEHMGFELGRKIKKKYGKCTKINQRSQRRRRGQRHSGAMSATKFPFVSCIIDLSVAGSSKSFDRA